MWSAAATWFVPGHTSQLMFLVMLSPHWWRRCRVFPGATGGSKVRLVVETQDEAAALVVNTTGEQFAQVYDRLKAMASRHRVRAGQPGLLCTTEIVHEAFLRMQSDEQGGPTFKGDLEFFSYAARAMRHILIDLARRQLSGKGGGELKRVDITETAAQEVMIDPTQALELDAAIADLAADSARAAQVLELHFFAGVPLDGVAELLKVSARTVDRDWRYARAFLAERLNP
jgi:RNA polymerase sigma factor (TIGR02999 family)